MKNKQKIQLILLLVFPWIIWSQTQEFLPVDPTMASLFKLDNKKAGEYTGTVTTTIPVYTIDDIGLQLPISLSYTSGGIKVSEDSGVVGLGWNLNVGGVISREIRGRDDFKGRAPYLTNSIPDLPASNNLFPQRINYVFDKYWPVNGVNHDFGALDNNDVYQMDFEPDRFHFNFLGYSGEFFFKKDGTIMCSEENDLHIKKTSNNGYINWEITDPKGYKYIFNRIQETYVSDDDWSPYISSWLLTKIISPTQREISLNYVDDGFAPKKTTLLPSYSEKFHFKIPISGPLPNTASTQLIQTLSPKTRVDNINLESINFSTGKVIFEYDEDRKDLEGGVKLTTIKVYDKSNTNPVVNAQLNYSYFQGNSSSSYDANLNRPLDIVKLRLKLDSVKVNAELYTFDYFKVGSIYPSKASLSQDHWGYYNAKQNKYLVPYYTMSSIGGQGDDWIIGGDRTPTNGAKAFSLRKITYPTGGYTIFDYELNTYDMRLQDNSDPPVASESHFTFISSSAESTQTKIINTGDIENNVIELDISIKCEIGNPYSIKPGDAYCELLDKNGNSVWKWDFNNYLTSGNMENNSDDPKYDDRLLQLNSVRENISSNSSYTLVAHFSPDIQDISSSSTVFGESYIGAKWKTKGKTESLYTGICGGLRIRSIKDYDAGGALEKEETFNYNFEDPNYEKSSGVLMSNPLNYFEFGTEKSKDELKPHIYVSNSIVPPFKTRGGFVGYREVTSTVQSKTDGSKLGKTVRRFYNKGATILRYDLWSHGLEVPINGILYEEEQWKSNKENNIELIKKTKWGYEVNGISADIFDYNELLQNPKYGYGSKLGRIALQDDLDKRTSLFFYPVYSNHVTLKQVSVENYLGGKVEKENRYKYTTLKTFPSIDTVTTSNSGKNIVTKTFYPDDITGTTFLSGGNLTIEEYNTIKRLKKEDLYHIAEPIQVETWQDGRKLSTQRTTYKELGNDLVLPKEILTSKETRSLKPSIRYHKYDSYGNPLELSLVNGPHITYLWGYNGQYPVAKIENATYAEVTATGVNLSVLQSISSTEAARITELNKIRNHTTMTNTQVTTYTYKPLIGVSTITNPRGEKTTYTYDTFNRLQFIKDETNKLLEEYKYHYKN